MPNGTGNVRNFQISRKKDNLERLTEVFEMNFRKFSVPFDSEPEFSEILVEWKAPTESRANTVIDIMSETCIVCASRNDMSHFVYAIFCGKANSLVLIRKNIPTAFDLEYLKYIRYILRKSK